MFKPHVFCHNLTIEQPAPARLASQTKKAKRQRFECERSVMSDSFIGCPMEFTTTSSSSSPRINPESWAAASLMHLMMAVQQQSRVTEHSLENPPPEA
jgi:hypothetical protein